MKSLTFASICTIILCAFCNSAIADFYIYRVETSETTYWIVPDLTDTTKIDTIPDGQSWVGTCFMNAASADSAKIYQYKAVTMNMAYECRADYFWVFPMPPELSTQFGHAKYYGLPVIESGTDYSNTAKISRYLVIF